ncbi:MAG: SlyX family protein [Spirochaetales bacterium]|nr:SlyX family protein [Spirochaetales bacterium]
MSEERIIRLETKLAYQDDLVQQLNEVIIDQQQRIHDLENKTELLSKKLEDLLELAAEERNTGERPPHY